MTINVNPVRLFYCVAMAFVLFQPVVGHAQSSQTERQQAEAMQFGLLLGASAIQYDQCVARGYISPGSQKAEDLARQFIKTSKQAAPNEEKENYANVQKGWDLAKQKINEQGPKYWEDNCVRINEQWNKYLKMLKQ